MPRPLALLALILLPVSAAAAPPLEAASAALESAFLGRASAPAPRLDAGFSGALSGPSYEFDDQSAIDKLHIHSLKESRRPGVFRAAPGANPSRTIDLGPLLDRNLKAGLSANLGGRPVWLSGVFDKTGSAFVSLLVDGEPVRVFGVADLLMSPQTLSIGSGRFKLKLSPDITDQLASEIMAVNLGDNHKDRITLRALLRAVGASGEGLSVEGQAYTLFYFDQVQGDRLDVSGKTFALIATNPAGEIHIFVIPAGVVPADKTAVFSLLGGRPLGLRRDAGALGIYLP